MLNRLSVKGRMGLIIAALILLFGVMIFFTIQTAGKVKDQGLVETGGVMLEDQKAKVLVASHSMAVSIGKAISKLDNSDDKVDLIREMVNDIRFEEDKSGYFFVYRDTTNIAMPTNKDLIGKDLGEMKDKNNVYVIRELRDKAKAGGGFVNYI